MTDIKSVKLKKGGELAMDEPFEVKNSEGQPIKLTLRQLRESYLKNTGYAALSPRFHPRPEEQT